MDDQYINARRQPATARKALEVSDNFRVVYRAKTSEEAQRRADRGKALVGTRFVRLPGNPPDHKILFVSRGGQKIRVSEVEMVFNDALLMDAVADWGKDGPLYRDTIEGIQLEVYEYAIQAYRNVDLPPQLIRKQ